MTANPETPLRSLMAETDEGATAALFVDLCRESPALRHWLWEDFARDAKTREAFALRLRSRKATTIPRIAELTEDMAPWHEEVRALRARISTQIFGGLTWAEIESLIGQYRAGRVDPAAFLIALQWHRAGKRATRSPRLLRSLADFIDLAMRGGDRRALSQLAAASQLVATVQALKKRRASVGYTDWWKLQTLFYILRHPRESYRTREIRAHLTTLGLQVGTKDIRRFCTRHGIRRDMRAGRPRSRT